MAFDPNFPPHGAELVSAEFRAQFNALHDERILSAVVDGVTALDPGATPTVVLSVEGNVLHASFGIPRGEPGATGADGGPGPQGPMGPPATNVIFDGVSALPWDQDPTANVYLDGSNLHVSFAIPRGQPGEQGPAGEVTTLQLNDAIAGTARNPSSVATLDASMADPDDELLRQKLNELILAARR